MNFLKNLFSKGNMPGMMGFLSAIPGFDIDALMPQAEAAAVGWFKDMQQKAGQPLIAMASLDQTGDRLILSLYKILPGGQLEIWQELPISELKKLIENLKNDADFTTEPTAGLYPAAITAAIPGTAAAEPTAATGTEPATASGSDPATGQQ